MRGSNSFVSTFCLALLAIVMLGVSAGCGGGGQGLRIPSNPLVITSSSLPTMVSGEYVDFEVPLSGGCGGPYVVEVIAGTLPLGVGTLEGTEHKLQGFILEDGIFSFTLKITDTTCTPFLTTTQAYVWDIQQGPVRIVDANPAIIPNADYDDPQKHPNDPGPDGILGTVDDITVDALQTVVFSTFIAYNLITAGGQAPYTCSVVDDPNDPLDGGLPLGVSMAPNSCSLVGTPVQVLAGGVPFRMTFQVTDAVGQSATRKLQWKIDTPPLILSNTSLVDGKAGTSYSDAIQIVDGVPPFAYELTDNAPDDDGDPDTTDNLNDNITYPPGFTPVINGWVLGGFDFQLSGTGPSINNARLHASTGRVAYPLEADDGLTGYSPMPSEGLYFRESGPGGGSFFGTPRRRGTFTMFVHAFSTLVPNERGQHVFKALSHTIVPSEPPVGTNPAFDMNPGFTVEGAFPALPDLASLAEAEVTVLYNPDVSTGHPANGLKLLSQGGVGYDGFFDAPHEINRGININEPVGEHQWVYNEITPLTGMSMFSPGIWGTEFPADAASLQRSGARPLAFTVNDLQLPLSVRASDTTLTRQFNISVGPDKVIITESTQSFTGTTTTGSSETSMHDRSIKVRGFEVLGGSGVVSDLKDADTTPTHSVPAIAGLTGTDQIGKLISGTSGGDATIDLLRISVNPNGWWDDSSGMNPKGARAHVGADKNTGRTYYQANGWYNSGGGWHGSVGATDLPDTPSVAHNPAGGVYNDGGKLYAFDSNNRFGLFVVRNDATVYVPFAVQKGTLGVWKFGDGMVSTGPDSNFKMVAISVSPDGRYAATKLVKTTSTSFNTILNKSNAVIVIFSLTGEKFSGGETYQIVNPDTGTGNYMYSMSIAMTDQGMYYLTGDYSSTYGSWRNHYINQYLYRTSAGALIPAGGSTAVAASLASGVGTNWFNTSGNPMQTPFQKSDNPTSSISTFLSSTGTFGIITIPNQEMYLYDGWNMGENSTAPVPFRVSADGKHCALLAGKGSGGTSGSDVMSHYAWVSSNGGAFRQASTVARHCPNGASRGYNLRRGPTSYQHWGRFSGPTTAFEIADDGSAIAFVHNTVGSVSSTSNSSNWNNAREDVVVSRGNGSASDPFTSSTETEVTKNIFGGAIKWRFGSLVFTKNNTGLIFWGGASSRSATSTTGSGSGYLPSHSTHFLGTYYAFNLNVANQVRGVMPTTAGGIGTFPTYSSSSKFAPATPTWTTNLGVIKPFGGFISRNRNYFYVVNYHPTSGSDQTQVSLLGINIEDLTNGGTASGHQKGRGFKPTAFPSRRGFLPEYYYMPHYGLDLAYFIPAHVHGGGMQTMNRETGAVYWMSHYMASGPTRSTSTSSFSSGPTIATYWSDQGYRGFHMEAFNADVGGPVARLTHSGLGGNTSSRSGQYFVVSQDGSKVAYVYQNQASTRVHNSERVGVVTHIDFDASTGAASADMDNGDTNKAYVAENSTGRSGETMAFDSGGTKLYYAFRSGANNENAKQLVELTQNPGTGAKTFRRFGPNKRYNVLHSGR